MPLLTKTFIVLKALQANDTGKEPIFKIIVFRVAKTYNLVSLCGHQLFGGSFCSSFHGLEMKTADYKQTLLPSPKLHGVMYQKALTLICNVVRT